MPDLMPWHLTKLSDMDYNRVDLVKEGANSMARIKLFKSKEGGPKMTLEEILKSLKPEHQEVVRKALEAKEQEATAAVQKAKDLEDQIAKSKTEGQATPAPQSEEEILKSIKDPGLRAVLETQITKAKAAEDQIRKMRDAEVDREAISKAKEVPNLGAEETVLVDVYKKLKNADEALCEEVFGIFKAASALTAQGGVAEIGKSAGKAGEIGVSGSEEEAWAKIEKKAEEIAKAAGISQQQAIRKTISENPQLYQEYLKAQQN